VAQQANIPTGGWQTLVDDLDVILWEADPATFHFLYVSRGAERILGYPVGNWLTDDGFWEGIIHPEDREGAKAFCIDRSRSGEDHQFEYRAVHRDGSTVWLRDFVHVVKDEEGRPALLRGAMMDISETKRAEAALQDEQARYRILADNVLDLVSLHGSDGRFLFVSPSSREITGYEPEDLVGKGLEAVVHPEDLPDLFAAIRSVLEGNDPPAIVFRVVHRSGEIRWCETKGNLVPSSNGSGEVRLAGVTRDISERRLLQEELGKAQRLEALGRLAGGIAHDFNNLLTVVQGHLDFLRPGLADRTPFLADLDEAERAVQRAAALTRQLLTFGRRDLSRPRVLDLGETLKELEPLLRRLLPGSIHLDSKLPATLIPVRMDPGQFEQILVNLAMNARDAMPVGGTLSIELQEHQVGENDLERLRGMEARRYALIRVTDTGSGMDAGTLARIVEPFFTTKGTVKGTGLGLAIVYGVVSQSGGYVQAESEVGAGSTFAVWLPLADERENGVTHPAEAESQTILLAEDEQGVRTLITSVLERHGYRVIATGSMEDALAGYLACNGEVHLLLAHMVLPSGTGMDLARRLRLDRPGLPVLLMTAHSESGVVADPPAEDGIHFISKPISAEGIVSALRRALEG